MPKKHLLFAITLISLFAASRYFAVQPAEFDTVQQCEDYLQAKGVHYIRVADHEFSYLVISTVPLTLDEARAVSMKSQSADTPGFARARLFRNDYLPDCPNLRFWGKVYAFGDLDVINRVDPR